MPKPPGCVKLRGASPGVDGLGIGLLVTTTKEIPMDRREYEMSDEELEILMGACKPVTWMKIGTWPKTPQENANHAWQQLGVRMGFNYHTVEPIPGKSTHFFTAAPNG